MNRLDAAPLSPIGTESLRRSLERMAEFVTAEGDGEQGAKYRELAAKLERGLLTLAFCGHFSAGKSTLVNALCGANLLPSSPIPTSANVVTIADGAPSARMSFRSGDGTVLPEKEIPIAELHGFAVDGEGVASLEVTYPVPLLGGTLAIVDTPGVDSTDSAHRAATESALHLADVVFYVTDYNHVLSDVNFRFLRQLADWGKPAYVIVNQIDKHRESEVAFESFRDGIRQALEAWKIRPAGLLFLSLRVPGHPLSQWGELLTLIERLKPLRGELMRRSAARSAVYLAELFRESLRENHREERERLHGEIGDAEEGAYARLAETRRRLEEELRQVRGAGNAHKDAVRTELDRLLENANLTPAETRDKAGAVLESLQPGFKVGWFGGAAKTEAERESRLSLLTDDLNRQISANLNGHVRELLRREAREAGWEGEDMEAALEAAFEPATPGWLRERVKPGMGADGQAVLNFAADVSAEIKSRYRRAAMGFMDRILALRQPELDREAERLTSELADLQRRETAAAAHSELERSEEEVKERLLALLPERASEPEPRLPQPAQTAASAGVFELADVDELADDRETPEEAAADFGSAELSLGAPAEAVSLLEQAAALLRPIPALAKTADGLTAKAERFRSRRFTIALFGAFSAGKSSFANALIGQPALPVSPNPTTAAINRIVAPTPEHPAGTAYITMKSGEAMMEDIRHSLRRLGVPQAEIDGAGTAEALLGLAVRMNGDDVHPRGKPHLAFLRAASEGWSRYGGLLGTRFPETGEGYRQYAADEQASCFVAEIDLSVDSPLTRGGAVLVDTPGADSINARHTGVAFEYIKNSDAVLFVTYYNHAFTEADRQFLNQLGSVKDVFELDKMFFLINAADLASSEDELAAVREHVAKQLLKHGIRNPRLFAVSSLRGLDAKLAGNARQWESSGLAAFEQAFHSFARTELGGLAAASARKEIERAGRQLDGWLQAATADADARKAEADRWMALAETWRENGRRDAPGAAVQPLLQEAAEQLYHLRQRAYYRFGEHFQTAFHPSVLQDDGRDLKKLLVACWEDLKRGLGEDLAQELRSAGLRLEGTLERSVGEVLNAAAAELAKEGFALEPSARPALELPIGEPYRDGPLPDAKRLWQAFKSPKHFFENEGKNALRDWAAELLFQTADEWLSSVRETWNARLAETYRRTLRDAYAELSGELAEYASSLGASMTDPAQTARLQEIRGQWEQWVRGIGNG
ncbi:dynamin family protein [Cohnella caldifontis]|uniref:dynamin family protein n=1 Tax=Cohnella caldifontis TaxID=3027471 RepID=UPI0023ECA29F|nr:dynamin family protein [Cohnella sp. YIM B05605]